MEDDELHSLVLRQARRAGITELATPPNAEQWANFVARVSSAYAGTDRDRYLLERSLELSSDEMQGLHAELAIEQQLLHSVLAALSSAVLYVDNQWEVQFANATANELLHHGSTGEGALFDLVRFATPDGRTIRPSRVMEEVESGEPFALRDALVTRPDGTSFPASITFNPILDQGALSGIVLSIDDIGEHKRAQRDAEAARVEAMTAEKARRAQATFLANMSHELRTPLNAILGYAELVTEHAEEVGYHDLLSDLGRIQTAGRHLLGLINDILDVSKIEAGRVDLELSAFSVQALIDDLVGTMQALARQAGNTIEVRVDDDGDVHSDYVRLSQALLNVLGNANKFTQDGTIRVTVSGSKSDVRVVIADEGIGISQEDLERVFEPFAQADSSTTRKYGGTGLGLTITRNLCEMLGIALSVDSAPDQGAAFEFVIPRAFHGAHEATPPTERRFVPRPQSKVLVVDDDPATHDVIRRTLADAGIEVISATTGAEGLRLAQEARPDSIILDILLPDIEGWEVLLELKSNPDTADIPLIVVSIVEDANRAFRLGAQDYLVKPVDRERLLSTLTRYESPDGDNVVMVVEDDEALRELLCGRIAREAPHWEVVPAANGRQACEQLEAGNQPRLVLLDLMMPEMDGFEFLEHIRAKSAWADIPVIVVTAMTLTRTQQNKLNRHVERIIKKGEQTPGQIADAIVGMLQDTPTEIQK